MVFRGGGPITAALFIIIYFGALIATYGRKSPQQLKNGRPTLIVRIRWAEYHWPIDKNSTDSDKRDVGNTSQYNEWAQTIQTDTIKYDDDLSSTIIGAHGIYPELRRFEECGKTIFTGINWAEVEIIYKQHHFSQQAF